MIDSHLENKVINDATALTTVSKTISKSYKKLFHVIHNGYDEDDFTAINKIKNNAVVIRYIGTMTKSQYPSNFFESINELNLNKKKYQIELIGNIHPDIKYYIETKKYDNFIKIKPYIPHKEAIKKMCESRFLLLVIPNTQKNMGIVTGKLFEYIRSGSKILMIGPIDSDAAKIIHETNSGYCFDYNEKDSFKKILIKKSNKESRNYEQYSRVHLTRLLAEIFNKINK